MRIFNGKASDSAAPEATPNDLKDRLEACLLPDESQRFSLEIDLDEGLHFCPGLLVLTSRRLISISKGSPENYKIGPELELRCRDSRDTDSLELIRGTERLRVWRFTAARRAAAHRFERMFERLRHGDLEEDELNGDGYAAL